MSLTMDLIDDTDTCRTQNAKTNGNLHFNPDVTKTRWLIRA